MPLFCWSIKNMPQTIQYKLIVYIPETALEAVKQAMFAAGAGTKAGSHYDSCCWQTLGQGQFRPLLGAKPAIGVVGQLVQLPEWRVELLVEGESCLHQVIQAMKQVHPYEEVAYEVYRLVEPF